MAKAIYQVTEGIFEGHVFVGEPYKTSNDITRIWDFDSQGRSYPESNCKLLKELRPDQIESHLKTK